MSDKEAEVLTPELFSDHVLYEQKRTGNSLLECITDSVERFGIEEEDVKKLITEYLMSRLTAECLDSRLLKGIKRSVKILGV